LPLSADRITVTKPPGFSNPGGFVASGKAVFLVKQFDVGQVPFAINLPCFNRS
jgi:hypothetical protein